MIYIILEAFADLPEKVVRVKKENVCYAPVRDVADDTCQEKAIFEQHPRLEGQLDAFLQGMSELEQYQTLSDTLLGLMRHKFNAFRSDGMRRSVTTANPANPSGRSTVRVNEAAQARQNAEAQARALRALASAEHQVAVEMEARNRAETELVQVKARLEDERRARLEAESKVNTVCEKVQAHAFSESQARAQIESQLRAQFESHAQGQAESHARMLAEARAELETKNHMLVEARAEIEAKNRMLAQASAEVETKSRMLAEASAEVETKNHMLAEAHAEVEAKDFMLAEAEAVAEAKNRMLASQSETQALALAQARAENEEKARLLASQTESQARALAQARAENDEKARMLATQTETQARALAHARAENEEKDRMLAEVLAGTEQAKLQEKAKAPPTSNNDPDVYTPLNSEMTDILHSISMSDSSASPAQKNLPRHSSNQVVNNPPNNIVVPTPELRNRRKTKNDIKKAPSKKGKAVLKSSSLLVPDRQTTHRILGMGASSPYAPAVQPLVSSAIHMASSVATMSSPWKNMINNRQGEAFGKSKDDDSGPHIIVDDDSMGNLSATTPII